MNMLDVAEEGCSMSWYYPRTIRSSRSPLECIDALHTRGWKLLQTVVDHAALFDPAHHELEPDSGE